MRSTRVGGLVVLAAGLGVGSVGAAGFADASLHSSVAASKGAPVGNNGTIKIQDVGASGNADDPHVGCAFQLSLFNYDTGTDSAVVTFTSQAPSSPSGVTVSPTSGPSNFTFTGNGPSGGFDVTKVYQLDLSGLTAQPQQGYHIKVSVDVTGAKNADDKYKVFFVGPCASAPTTTTTTVPSTTTTVPSTTTTVPSTTTTVPSTTTTVPSTTTTVPSTTTPATGSGTAPQQGTTLSPVPSTSGGSAGPSTGEGAAGPSTGSGSAGLGAGTTGGSNAGATGTGSQVVVSGSAQGVASSGAPVSQTGAAALTSSAPLPAGAGTDLGYFQPSSSGQSPASWGLLAAGGGLLALAGEMMRRRSRTNS